MAKKVTVTFEDEEDLNPPESTWMLFQSTPRSHENEFFRLYQNSFVNDVETPFVDYGFTVSQLTSVNENDVATYADDLPEWTREDANYAFDGDNVSVSFESVETDWMDHVVFINSPRRSGKSTAVCNFFRLYHSRFQMHMFFKNRNAMHHMTRSVIPRAMSGMSYRDVESFTRYFEEHSHIMSPDMGNLTQQLHGRPPCDLYIYDDMIPWQHTYLIQELSQWTGMRNPRFRGSIFLNSGGQI